MQYLILKSNAVFFVFCFRKIGGFFGKGYKINTLILIMQELIPINIVIGDRTYRIKDQG